MTDLAVAGAVYAEANWGRWVARCPAPWCTNAVALDRGQVTFGCAGMGGCGASGHLVWPADPDAVETILTMRPVPATRNWLSGETLEQLLLENAAHGIVDPAWDAAATLAGGSAEILVAIDERVVGGMLHHQLEAAGLRREIGA